MARWAVRHRNVNIRLSCRTFSISETCYRYQPQLSDENEQIADHLLALVKAKKRWGFGFCYLYLRNVKGFGWNHKRVYPIGRQAHLSGVRIEYADQATQTPAKGQAGTTDRA